MLMASYEMACLCMLLGITNETIDISLWRKKECNGLCSDCKKKHCDGDYLEINGISKWIILLFFVLLWPIIKKIIKKIIIKSN